MKITRIKFDPNNTPSSTLKATAAVTVNDSLILHGVKVMAKPDKPDQFFLSYPSYKLPSGQLLACFHPAKGPFREEFSTVLLDAYNSFLSKPSQATFVLADMEPAPFVITKATVRPILNYSSPVRANVSIELEGSLFLRGMALHARRDGSLWLHMPQRELRSGRSVAIYHPVTKAGRAALNAEIMPYYDDAVRESLKRAANRSLYQ